MFLALKDGQRAEAVATGDRAVCPLRGEVVIAKCGRRIANHWAHEAGADCDEWSKSKMTPWHRDWQGSFPEHQREWVFNDGEHLADILTILNESVPWLVRRGSWHYLGDSGRPLKVGAPLVIELQHSYLPVDQIEEREEYYGKYAQQMVWIWDCHKPFEAGRLHPRRGSQQARKSFTWGHFRRTLNACTYPSFLDLGTDELLLVTKWPPYERQYGEYTEYGTSSWMGWGSGYCYQISRKEFVRALQLPKS